MVQDQEQKEEDKYLLQFTENQTGTCTRARSLIQYLPIPGNCHDLPRDELTTVFESCFSRSLQTTAAWNLHADDSDALDIIVPDDLRKLFGVIDAVELRASDHSNLAFHEILVHVGIDVSGAVRRDEQFCTIFYAKTSNIFVDRNTCY